MRFILSLIALVVSITTINAGAIHFEIDFNGLKCPKYSRESATHFKVLRARILYTNDKGKIIGNAVCKAESSSCPMVGQQSKNVYVSIAVKPLHKSLYTDDVDYQYDDKLFGLMELRKKHGAGYFLMPYESQLYVNRVRIIDDNGDREMTSKCTEPIDSQTLIFDHGFFITQFDSSKSIKWENMYFDPPTVGKTIVFEDRYLNEA
ncbi:unnamed protein product [Caenorhabditis bovis]|uniref:Uncharacterized protein n=1 Tax=Caenorhabditis bovis TaxID=2654633 RepID=A0A8S1F0E8_9PELO|nr:unnamed protein product [Caenorhabditis bovis]